ncbi:hypothetical protein [Streptomyces chartreusis]|uniref:hypothetical protein n=1 Tax=Streptomyces chartreusis TaxID=1969 RepID=UPI0035D59F2A
MVTWPQFGLYLLAVAVCGLPAGLFVGSRFPQWRAPIGLALRIVTVALLAIVVMAVVGAVRDAPDAMTWTQLMAVVLVGTLVLLLAGGGFLLVRRRPLWRQPLEEALLIVVVALLVILVMAVTAALLGK